MVSAGRHMNRIRNAINGAVHQTPASFEGPSGVIEVTKVSGLGNGWSKRQSLTLRAISMSSRRVRLRPVRSFSAAAGVRS